MKKKSVAKELMEGLNPKLPAVKLPTMKLAKLRKPRKLNLPKLKKPRKMF